MPRRNLKTKKSFSSSSSSSSSSSKHISHKPFFVDNVDAEKISFPKSFSTEHEGPYHAGIVFFRGKQRCTIIADWPVIPLNDLFLYSIDNAPWASDSPQYGSTFKLNAQQSKQCIRMQAKPCSGVVLQTLYKLVTSSSNAPRWKGIELVERTKLMDVQCKKAFGWEAVPQCTTKIPHFDALTFLQTHEIARVWAAPLLRAPLLADYWITSRYPRLLQWFPLCSLRRVPLSTWSTLHQQVNVMDRDAFLSLCFDPPPWFTTEALKEKKERLGLLSGGGGGGERTQFHAAVKHVEEQDVLRRQFLLTGQIDTKPQHMASDFKCPPIPFDCSLDQIRVLHALRIQMYRLSASQLAVLSKHVFDESNLHVFIAIWMYTRLLSDMGKRGCTMLPLNAASRFSFLETKEGKYLDHEYRTRWHKLTQDHAFDDPAQQEQAFQWLVESKHCVIVAGRYITTNLWYENALCIRRILRKFYTTRHNHFFCPPQFYHGLINRSTLSSSCSSETPSPSKKRSFEKPTTEKENQDEALFVQYSTVSKNSSSSSSFQWAPEQQSFIASTHPIQVASGGGGTGKTEMVKTLRGSDTMALPDGISCFPPTIMVVGPTNQLSNLFRTRVRETVSTIHRIIEVLRHGGTAKAEWLMQIRILIMDEAGMLDEWMLGALCRLTTMLPSLMRIVFSGDSNQASSVSPGNILTNLIAFHPIVHHTHLIKNHRVAPGAEQMTLAIQHVLQPQPLTTLQWLKECALTSMTRKEKGEAGLCLFPWMQDHSLSSIAKEFKTHGPDIQMVCHTNVQRLKINLDLLKHVVPFKIPADWTQKKQWGQEEGKMKRIMPKHLIKGVRLVVNRDRIECINPYTQAKRTLFKSQRFHCEGIFVVASKKEKKSTLHSLPHTSLEYPIRKLLMEDHSTCVSLQLRDLMGRETSSSSLKVHHHMTKKSKKMSSLSSSSLSTDKNLQIEDCPWKMEEETEMVFEVRLNPTLVKMELGYVVTVHKMQGLESQRMIILVEPHSMRKSILYTGVSRSKYACDLYVLMDDNFNPKDYTPETLATLLAEKVFACAQSPDGYRYTVLHQVCGGSGK